MPHDVVECPVDRGSVDDRIEEWKDDTTYSDIDIIETFNIGENRVGIIIQYTS